MLKDRLYTFAADNPARRSSQTVLNLILHALTRMLAPTLSFTAEEVWQAVPNQPGREPSLFLCSWPRVEQRYVDEELAGRWESLLKVRASVTKALEIARQQGMLGNSLEATVSLYPAKSETADLLKRYEKALRTVLIVSQVELHSPGEPMPADISANGEDVSIAVRKAAGKKCKRCWNYSETVGESDLHPSLCGRCINELGGPDE
jgi:isoleucyl-tRNA synthetase